MKKPDGRVLQGHEDAWLAGDELSGKIDFHDMARL